MWMHNGGLGGWKYIKRRLGDSLADKWYLSVQGGTDSEWAFALFLDTLERKGYNPSSPPPTGFGPTVLRQAMLATIKRTNDFIAEIPAKVIEEEQVDTRSLLNFAVTDGHSVVCTRYIRSKTDEAASLYYSSGTSWVDKNQKGEFHMDRKDKGADIVLVASEPLTFERGENSNLSHLYFLTSSRNVGDCPYQFDPHNPQADSHGAPNRGRILQLQSISQTIIQARTRQRPGHKREGNSNHTRCHQRPTS